MRRSRARVAHAGNSTQVIFTTKQTAKGTRFCEIPIQSTSGSTPKQQKVKPTQSDDNPPMASDLPELSYHEVFQFTADIEPPTTKVWICSYYRYCSHSPGRPPRTTCMNGCPGKGCILKHFLQTKSQIFLLAISALCPAHGDAKTAS